MIDLESTNNRPARGGRRHGAHRTNVKPKNVESSAWQTFLPPTSSIRSDLGAAHSFGISPGGLSLRPSMRCPLHPLHPHVDRTPGEAVLIRGAEPPLGGSFSGFGPPFNNTFAPLRQAGSSGRGMSRGCEKHQKSVGRPEASNEICATLVGCSSTPWAMGIHRLPSTVPVEPLVNPLANLLLDATYATINVAVAAVHAGLERDFRPEARAAITS